MSDIDIMNNENLQSNGNIDDKLKKLESSLLFEMMMEEDFDFDESTEDSIIEEILKIQKEKGSPIVFNAEEMLKDFNKNYRLKAKINKADDKNFTKEKIKYEKKGLKVFKRFAAMAAGMIIFFTALLYTSDVKTVFAGKSFFDVIVSWTEEVFSKRYVKRIDKYQEAKIQDGDEEAKDNSKYFKSMDIAEKKYGIIFMKPTYMPNGYELESIRSLEKKSNELKSLRLDYVKGEDEITFTAVVVKAIGSGGHIEKNQEGVKMEEINGTKYYIFQNLEWTVATWLENDIDYTLTGKVSYDEMLKIIKSLEY